MPSSVDHSRQPASTPTDDRGAALAGAERWLEAELGAEPAPALLVVIGLGDGELLDVLDRRAPETKVLGFEPDAATAARFLRRSDVPGRRKSGRLIYLADPDYAGVDEAWRAFPAAPDNHKLIVSPAVAREAGPGAVRAARVFKDLLFGVRANAEARRRFAPGYLAGTLHNLPEIIAGQDVRALAGAYPGVPAVIAAAGPSLDAIYDDLAAVRDRALLIAADTALRPLLTRGLAPDFVVAVDPQVTNARHFHSLPACPDTWLVSEASIDPSVITPFGRRAFWFRVADHEPWSWYRELGIEVGQVDVWGSVLTAAFQVAVLAGCDPIVIVGADLAFTGGRPYCRGTTYEFDWAHVISEGHELDRAWRPFMKPEDEIRVPDVHGVETHSTGALQSFRDWIVARAARSGRRVINATGAGILFGEGVVQSSLRDALPNPAHVTGPHAIARKAPSSTAGAELARRLWAVHRTACRNEQSTPPLDRWKTFSGDGFNLEAIAAAIERAAHVLEQPLAPAGPGQGAVIPWDRLAPTGVARDILPHLPEAVARLRSALHGDASLRPKPMPGIGFEAFEILRAICAAAADAEDLPAPLPAALAGRAPIGSRLTEPAAIAWAVRLFEGCLGEAMPSALPVSAADPSFLSRHVVPRDPATEALPRNARPPARPNFMQACALLALEWLTCVRQADAGSRADRAQFAAWWRRLAAAVASPEDAGTSGTSMSLVLESSGASSIDVPLPGRAASLARLLTGALREGHEPIVLGRFDAEGRSASLHLRVDAVAAASGEPKAAPAGPMVSPRVLTDEGATRALFAYSTEAGAVCVGLNRQTSVLVREDGSVGQHLTWPRPINGELPFGVGGAVAWGVGKAVWPDGGPGYVMFRSTKDASPEIVELPFGPTTGVCENGRLYWTCFPFGVGSWAPGETPAFALPDLSLYAVQPDAAGFVLHPRVRGTTGVTERRLPPHGWRWQPGHAPTPFPLGPSGSASSRSTQGTWTAVAHPEADLIRLESTNGVSLSMIAYYPFSVAWAGRSLLVCTSDGEVLLFERLLDLLEGWRRQ